MQVADGSVQENAEAGRAATSRLAVAAGSRRSLYVTFASSVLALESVLIFCATLAAWGLMQGFYGSGDGRYSLLPASERLRPLVLIVGLSLVGLLLAGLAVLRKPWGAVYGWGMQFLLCAFGVLLIPMFVVGVLFALMWRYAVKTGRSLDDEVSARERIGHDVG